MEALSTWFIKVNLGLLMMVTAYVLFLRKEKYFKWNRAFLLFAVFLPLILPLIPGISWSVDSPWPPQIPRNGLLNKISGTALAGAVSGEQALPQSMGFPVMTVLWVVYGSVCLWLMLRISFRLWQVSRLTGSCRETTSGGVLFCHHDLAIPAFSFFRRVVINPSMYDAQMLREITSHEKVHARQWHSADILAVDFLHAVFWINPFAGWLKKYIRLNLEFVADAEVLAAGADKTQYQYSLLHNSLGQRQNPLVNAFHSSKIKRRIYMINSTRNTNRNLYRFLLVLPFIVVTYLAVSPARAETIRTDVLPETPFQTGVNGYYQLDNDTSQYIHIENKGGKLTLKQMWDGMEIPFDEKTPLLFHNAGHNVDLSFSKNAAGEITQLLAFGRDTWIKVKKYSPAPVQKAIVLPAGQLQKYAGKYQMEGRGNEAVLQFVVKDSGLEVTELWRSHSFIILPASEKVFFGKNGLHYPVEFSFDDKGNVTQALIFHNDVWKKMPD